MAAQTSICSERACVPPETVTCTEIAEEPLLDADHPSNGVLFYAETQSDHFVRIAQVRATAEEVFGDQDKAETWLRRSSNALCRTRPLDLLDTDEGAREVETLLGRISHGIAV